jgi:hypothetical protein
MRSRFLFFINDKVFIISQFYFRFSEPQAKKLDWFFLGDSIVAFSGPLVSILFNNAI